MAKLKYHVGTQDIVRRFCVLILLVVFAVGTAAAAQKQTFLKEHYVYGPIRVFYNTTGKDAVSTTDANRNRVPDRVEDIAKQVWAAHYLYCGVLKFPDPFKSARYRGVTCIQISLRDLGGGNGLAFSSSQRARKIPQGKPSDRAIVMSINCKLNPMRNVTPAHETFHLVQYGATYFKNGWFLEGMARWAEHALGRDGIGKMKYSPNGPWPQGPGYIGLVTTKRYDAEHVLWNPIAKRAGGSDQLNARSLGRLASLRYSDGSPVLRDRSLLGAGIMREIVIELGKMDDVAFRDLKYDRWTGSNQTAVANNPYIYQAVMDVLRRRVGGVGPYEARKQTTSADDAVGRAFRVGSVWTGAPQGFKLTVTERNDGRFKARFESKSWAKIVSGTINGRSVGWKSKDVQAIKGSAGGDNSGVITRDSKGTRIDFVWMSRSNQGKFTLRKRD